MAAEAYDYLIIGGGLTGASAISGIREQDKHGSILLVSSETTLPYNRPPLTKDLWFGKKTVEQIFAQPKSFYAENGVNFALQTRVTNISPRDCLVTDSRGQQFHYEKLLLATGGIPRHLDIPGGNLDGVCYYRYLNDYQAIRERITDGASAVVIGGGFIGSEIAAALRHNKAQVTMIFPDSKLVNRVFPESLGHALTEEYRRRGITIFDGDTPASFSKSDGHFVTYTKNGRQVESDVLIVGVGITPDTTLAQQAGLTVSNGIEVDAYLQTSDPHIFAAGDNALFPYEALGEARRVEHWDNALTQGQYAGRNMAGARQAYSYMPYFFSDLFEFGYEAVGDVTTKLETVEDWQQENDTGVIYYMKDGKVRGVMLCNIWGKLDEAREIIRSGLVLSPQELRGAIRPAQQKAA